MTKYVSFARQNKIPRKFNFRTPLWLHPSLPTQLFPINNELTYAGSVTNTRLAAELKMGVLPTSGVRVRAAKQ